MKVVINNDSTVCGDLWLSGSYVISCISLNVVSTSLKNDLHDFLRTNELQLTNLCDNDLYFLPPFHEMSCLLSN